MVTLDVCFSMTSATVLKWLPAMMPLVVVRRMKELRLRTEMTRAHPRSFTDTACREQPFNSPQRPVPERALPNLTHREERLGIAGAEAPG